MTHSTTTTDHLSLTFAALADPTRRAMLARLGKGTATVGELAKPFSLSGPAITKHLKVLEKAGLITREKEAQWRRCRIEAQRLREANEYIEKYRQFWEASFDRLEVYLKKLQASTSSPTPLFQERGGEAGVRQKGEKK
ncbi:MAG: helix-turn-helix transcriptional regulator [Spirochaetes bacterium]|nr:helix-turn-helix transcriptional regulator [Spirochaetota bacterium]